LSTFTVVLLPAAEEEASEAFRWYFERSALAADAFREELTGAIDSLAKKPGMWPPDDDSIRRLVLRHFPFTVFYEVAGKTVTVFAVAHQRRRPGYWQDR